MSLTRRSLLNSASRAACGAAMAAFRVNAENASVPSLPATRKLKIVFTGGHPGDPEYGCGGTIAALTQQGHEVVLLYLNDGAWQATTAATRKTEAEKACKLLGARAAYVGQQNGHAVVDDDHYASYERTLKAEAPDAVFTHWLMDNHRDHRAMAMLSFDAWSKSDKQYALYYYEVSNGEDTVHFAPTSYVDISKTETRKRASCYAHASQSPERYYDLQDLIARFRGAESGCARAEAYLLQPQSPFNIFSTAVTH